MRLVLVSLAVLAYGIAAACVLLGQAGEQQASLAATPAPAAPRADHGVLPIRAVGIQLQRTDWIDRYKQCIDEAADLGADAVKFVVDVRQEDGASNRIYIDMRLTPSAQQLMELIGHAKQRDLKVILMPIVLLDDPKGNEWRGTIKPESWASWFESYRAALAHFLWIAEESGVDIFVIGSELISSEKQSKEWDRTIREVRRGFSGLITYSSNWDHYRQIPFWESLDLIGMNSYWTLGRDGRTSVETIGRNWGKIKAELEPFISEKGRPLLFLEVGWCSLDNAASQPWDYTRHVAVNLELQERLYQGFFEAWHGVEWLAGYSIWEWTPGEGGPEDRGYTPKNKPAEAVLRKWLAEPAWNVQ